MRTCKWGPRLPHLKYHLRKLWLKCVLLEREILDSLRNSPEHLIMEQQKMIPHGTNQHLT